eukprot:5929461-Prymnesium_polylepis.1
MRPRPWPRGGRARRWAQRDYMGREARRSSTRTLNGWGVRGARSRPPFCQMRGACHHPPGD